jgi:hypothetical protein
MCVDCPSPSANELTTLYMFNNGTAGIMFDVVAIDDVVIDGFDVNLAAGMYEIEIWYRAGSYMGVDEDPTAWTLAGTAPMVTSAGVDIATALPIAVDVVIPAAETYAWYITSTNAVGGTDQLIYTDGVMEGAPYTSDAHLEIREGRAKEYPFAAPYFPRVFNGTVHYHACD